jgi:hypothetical protein
VDIAGGKQLNIAAERTKDCVNYLDILPYPFDPECSASHIAPQLGQLQLSSRKIIVGV